MTTAKKHETGNLLGVIIQAFYGNRTYTEIYEESLDRYILGYLSDSFPVTEPIDRTMVPIPGTDNLVLIYNKFQEEEELLRKKELWEEERYELKPLAAFPELGICIYSRCLVCRINASGELESLQGEDGDKFMQYLAR